MKNLIRDSIVFQFYRILKVHQSYCGSRHEVVVLFFIYPTQLDRINQLQMWATALCFFYFLFVFLKHNLIMDLVVITKQVSKCVL